MKMSEFTTKSFLGNAGAAENSYILINYEDNSTSRPVTYKASLREIGKAIIQDQYVLKIDNSNPWQVQTFTSNNGAYVDTNQHLVSYNGELVTSGTKMVPKVIQYNSQQNKVGYYSTDNANSWTNINLGIDPSAPIATSIPNAYGNSTISIDVYPVVVDEFGTLYENSDSHVANILNIDVTHITANSQKAPIIYDLIQDQIGYFPTGTSDFTAIDVGGGGGSFDPKAEIKDAPVRFDPEASDITDTNIYPVCATRNGQLVFQDPKDDNNLVVFQPYESNGDLGHPLFFNETKNEIGYYKYESGERVWQAVNSLT